MLTFICFILQAYGSCDILRDQRVVLWMANSIDVQQYSSSTTQIVSFQKKIKQKKRRKNKDLNQRISLSSFQIQLDLFVAIFFQGSALDPSGFSTIIIIKKTKENKQLKKTWLTILYVQFIHSSPGQNKDNFFEIKKKSKQFHLPVQTVIRLM